MDQMRWENFESTATTTYLDDTGVLLDDKDLAEQYSDGEHEDDDEKTKAVR